MQYKVIIEIFGNILMSIGCVVVCFVVCFALYGLICGLKIKIKKILQRQSKIRCLCKHEYTLKWHWHYQEDLEEYCYICRKCGKGLRIKVVK